jgi:hypothetical protein
MKAKFKTLYAAVEMDEYESVLKMPKGDSLVNALRVDVLKSYFGDETNLDEWQCLLKVRESLSDCFPTVGHWQDQGGKLEKARIRHVCDVAAETRLVGRGRSTATLLGNIVWCLITRVEIRRDH